MGVVSLRDSFRKLHVVVLMDPRNTGICSVLKGIVSRMSSHGFRGSRDFQRLCTLPSSTPTQGMFWEGKNIKESPSSIITMNCPSTIAIVNSTSRCSSRCPSRCAIHHGYCAWTLIFLSLLFCFSLVFLTKELSQCFECFQPFSLIF